MSNTTRLTIATLAAVTMLSSFAVSASAQTCPGPMKIIVAYPPGSPDDVVARLLARQLGASNVAAVVENMPGASGKIGNAAAARAAPDGCTLLVVNSNVAVQAAGNAKTPYDIGSSFTSITLLTQAPETISVNPALPARTIQELVALLKTSPQKYSYASPGFASSPHLAGERLFHHTLGLDVAHVPHQGGPPAVTSTMGGHTQILHLTLPVVASAVKDGKLRMLAVADKRRHPMFPDVPTLAEAGILNHEVGFWNAILAPAGLPQAVTERLNRTINTIMAMPEVRLQLEAMGFTPRAGSQAELTQFMADDIAKVRATLDQTKITIE